MLFTSPFIYLYILFVMSTFFLSDVSIRSIIFRKRAEKITQLILLFLSGILYQHTHKINTHKHSYIHTHTNTHKLTQGKEKHLHCFLNLSLSKSLRNLLITRYMILSRWYFVRVSISCSTFLLQQLIRSKTQISFVFSSGKRRLQHKV